MAKKPSLTDITAGYGSATQHNANNDEIETAFENTLSRDGSTPNTMEADLDMNNNDILNVNAIDVVSMTLDGEEVTVSNLGTLADGSVTTAKLANSSVTSAKIADGTIATADIADDAVDGDKISLGSDAQGDIMYYDGSTWTRLPAGSSGQFLKTLGTGANPTWDTVSTGTEPSDGDKGDITVSGSGLTWTLDAGVVDTAELAAGAVTAAKIGAGEVDTAALAANSVDGTKIAMGSDAQGDILYYNGTNYVRLGAGTSGQFLQTQGAGADPQWANGGGLTTSTAQNASGNTSVSFTGLPSGLNKITVILSGVSHGTSTGIAFMRIGDSGGIEASGYEGSVTETDGSRQSAGSEWNLYRTAFSPTVSGAVTLYRIDSNEWVMAGIFHSEGDATHYAAGNKTLSGELTQLEVFAPSGLTYDGGKINIFYE